MSKVTVVGAGNVGATCANVLAVNEVANEIVLIDIKEGLAEGKAMDIMQTAQLMGFDSVVKGVTDDYSATADSDVVEITSGIPRKPGMTRESLSVSMPVLSRVLPKTSSSIHRRQSLSSYRTRWTRWLIYRTKYSDCRANALSVWAEH